MTDFFPRQMCQAAPFRCCNSGGWASVDSISLSSMSYRCYLWQTPREYREQVPTWTILSCSSNRLRPMFAVWQGAFSCRQRQQPSTEYCLCESDKGKVKVNGWQLCIVTPCQSSILMGSSIQAFPPELWPKHHAASVRLRLPTMPQCWCRVFPSLVMCMHPANHVMSKKTSERGLVQKASPSLGPGHLLLRNQAGVLLQGAAWGEMCSLLPESSKLLKSLT